MTSSLDAQRLATLVMDEATRAGARHVEVRSVRRRRESLLYADSGLESASNMADRGIGIRALVGDSWGYAGTNILTPDGLAQAARRAVAAASVEVGQGPVTIEPPVQGDYRTPMERDPFSVELDEKSAFFLDALAAMKDVAGTELVRRRASYTGHRIETTLMTSHGSHITQAATMCGGGVTAIAAHNGVVQSRSLPKSGEGDVLQRGWEHIEALNLTAQARRAAEEAVLLTQAPPLGEKRTTVILGGAQLSLQIHESVGHPTELDRVFGQEVSLAGTSFLLPDSLDALRYGSDLVNLVADSTVPTGLGTFGFDDEGTPATRQFLVRDGQLVGFLSGRDSAARIGRQSAACMRAEGWAHLPIVRMVNVNLEPGSGTLDDLIAGVDDGLLIDQNKSWSIDDLRLNFQFGCEVAWEIKAGKLTGKLYRDPVYTGVTPKFWNNCTGIAGPEAWRMWGWMFCGKGDPPQLMHVGHGCAPARFDDIQVRST